MNEVDLKTINSLESWLINENYSSYDWWDIWGMKYGQRAKQIYHTNKYLGSILIAPIIFLDLIYPAFRKYFVRKRTFPISHAHIILGYLNLYEATKKSAYVTKAEKLVEPLLKMASPSANGLGWGMKHKWTTLQGVIPEDTPCNTQTAYGYRAFVKLYELTKKEEYKKYLLEILRHVYNDFPEWRDGDKLSCSYSTIDKRKVVNANSYRMFMLVDGGTRFNNRDFLDKGFATLRYVISMQNPDGSWPYSEDQNFIDCYHTCFVLKNLNEIKDKIEKQEINIDKVINNGFKYYLENLFDKKCYPIPFAVKPRITIFKYDSYDLAESIGLLVDLNFDIKRIEKLNGFARSCFQTRKGYFIFRIYKLPFIKGIPYIRYANSAMFLALTKAYKFKQQKKHI